MTIDTTNIFSSTSGTTAFSGLSSGIDFNATINAIISARRQPAVTLENKISSNNSKVSAFTELNTLAGNFSTTLGTLRGGNSLLGGNVFANKSVFTSAAAASGAPADHTPSAPGSLVGVSASTNAATGTHKVKVNQIAQAHQIRGDSISSKTTDLTTLGVTAGTFDINGETITITAGDTLLDLRDKLNASNAEVNATVVSASDSSHFLVITANSTGTDSAISFGAGTTTSDDLGFTTGGAIKTTLQSALNASVDINGITGISRQTNTIDDAIEGVTLNLFAAEADTEITLQIENDLNAIKSSIVSFVDQYNALRDFVDDQRTEKVREGDTEASFGALAFDSTLRTMVQRMGSIVAGSVAGVDDGYQSLSQVGITVDENFKLVIDETELDNKLLASPDDMRKLFAFDFSSSDSRVTHLSHTGDTSYTVDGSNVVEPYYLNIDGTDASGNVTGANIQTAPASGSADGSATVDGQAISITDQSGAEGLRVFFNGGANASAVNDIEVSFTRGVADQLYFFFEELSKADGTLNTAISGLENQSTDFEARISEIDLRLEQQRASLEAQFIAMETALAQLNSQRDTLKSFTDAANSDN